MLNKLEVLKETELCGQQFAVYGTPQEPLFRAADVAKWINHSDVSKMIQKVDDDEKGTNIVRTPGGNQEVWFLTEDGLYEVLMQSRKPIAKQFKKGVKQILKQIRQTGSYTSLLAKSRESREDGVYDSDYPTLEDYFRKYVPAEYFVNMLFSIMKEYSSMADILPEEADNAYHKINVLLTFTNTLAANHRRGAFA